MNDAETKPTTELSYKEYRYFLEAVHNINRRADLPKHMKRQEVTGGTEATGKGRKFEKTIIKLSRRLVREANRGETRLQAAREAARLFLEVTSAADPKEYMAKEAEQGILGQRVGSDGSTIVVTVTALSSVKLIPNL